MKSVDRICCQKVEMSILTKPLIGGKYKMLSY
jgi:hypothetical protein